jgi:hypothetical protein
LILALYLRKWCFDVKTEKVLFKDEVACHLIYKEAELKVLNGKKATQYC